MYGTAFHLIAADCGGPVHPQLLTHINMASLRPFHVLLNITENIIHGESNKAGHEMTAKML